MYVMRQPRMLSAAEEIGAARLWCRLGGLGIEFGVGYAGVVDGFKALGQHALGIGYVAEGDGALAEIACLHLAVDDAVDQLFDAFFGKLFERARRGFYRIAHHEYGLLTRKGVGAGIGKELGVGLLALVLVLPLNVEVLYL